MGRVVISVDAELGGNAQPTDADRRCRERAWNRLVELFERYQVPATWAIVGRLFGTDASTEYPLRCDDAGTDAPALPAIKESLTAPDLVDRVLDSPVDHDVGSHSFGHPRFTGISRDVARADVAAAARVMSDQGIRPSSFVYPFNAVEHRDILAEFGFTCYRGRPPAPGSAGKTAGKRAVSLLLPDTIKRTAISVRADVTEIVDFTLGPSPPLVEPAIDEHGLVAVPASLPSLYRLPVRARETIRTAAYCPILRTARQGVDAAAEQDGLLHLWFHPGDFRTERDFQSFASLLEYVDACRKRGDVTVETMHSVAARTLAQHEHAGQAESSS